MYNSRCKKILFASPHVTDNGEAVPSRRLLTRSTSYIPYGEVFVEESSAGWQSPYYFNSKELDEETGLYYYGARYLNPTEARWLSVDPLFEKYVGMSPYNYCAGNPVKYVDPQGEENVIYVINLQSRETYIDIDKLIKQTNSEFANLGLKTRLVKSPVSPKNFAPQKMDKTDSYVVVGSADKVKNYILERSPEYEADYATWYGGASNPERSSNKVNTKTNAIGIDAKGTSDYAKSRKQSVLDFASFLVEHGTGHNASLNHSTEPNKREKQNCANSAIMGGGRWIDDALNGIGEFRNINEIKTNNHKYFNNSTYIKLMKEKFGDNLSKINYK